MPQVIHFQNASTKTWEKVDLDNKNPPMESGSFQIKKVLSDALRDQNLAILAGLGTSLCVRDATGNRIAPTMGDLWAEIVEGNTEAAYVIDKTNYTRVARRDLEDFLSFARGAFDYEPDPASKQRLIQFVQLAESTIVKRCSFVNASVNLHRHEMFVRRVGRRTQGRNRVRIFTTNYDRCFEEALTRAGFIVVDGFSLVFPRRFRPENFSIDFVMQGMHEPEPTPLPNVVHLVKIHGSIDWWRDVNGDIRQGDLPLNAEPLLIYPRTTKFQLAFEQPYLELMAKLQNSLRQPDTSLLIVGFGFGDEHISAPILSAMRSNLGLRILICDPALYDPAFPEDLAPALQSRLALRELYQFARDGDERISFIASGFEDIAPLIPDIAHETELEMHMNRVARLRNGAGSV